MALIGEMQYLTIGGKTYSLPAGGGGTVTSVAVSNATNGGLSVSGSPISSSGTITIGHSNVLAAAQTTQAVYPIKIDKNGHISAYGDAVTIPTVNNATLTIQKNGTTVNSFTANASSNVTANITVPTKTSDLTNDSGFITLTDVPEEVFVVTITYSNGEYSFDKTYAEIIAAYNAGKHIVGHDTSWDAYWYLYIASQYGIEFRSLTSISSANSSYPAHIYVNSLYLDSTNQVEYTNYELAVPSKTSHLTNDSGFVTTDEKVATANISSGTMYYPVLGTGATTAETKYQSVSGLKYTPTLGTSSINGSAILDLGTTISSSVTGWMRGILRLRNSNASYIDLKASDGVSMSGPRTIILPNKDGTVALTSDIPTTHSIPSGGTTGQALAKNSTTDYDVSWVNVTTTAAQIIRWTEST